MPARADERLEGKACRSVHLKYPAPESVVFYNDRNPVVNIDAGIDGARFFLTTGGETKNTRTPVWEHMNRPPGNLATLPGALPEAEPASRSPGRDRP